MNDILNKKIKLEQEINNSIWENFQIGLIYKFQNGKDLWINGNTHFNYEVDIIEEKLVLKLFPNGQDFFIELKYGEILYLQDTKQNFELRLKTKL